MINLDKLKKQISHLSKDDQLLFVVVVRFLLKQENGQQLVDDLISSSPEEWEEKMLELKEKIENS